MPHEPACGAVGQPRRPHECVLELGSIELTCVAPAVLHHVHRHQVGDRPEESDAHRVRISGPMRRSRRLKLTIRITRARFIAAITFAPKVTRVSPPPPIALMTRFSIGASRALFHHIGLRSRQPDTLIAPYEATLRPLGDAASYEGGAGFGEGAGPSFWVEAVIPDRSELRSRRGSAEPCCSSMRRIRRDAISPISGWAHLPRAKNAASRRPACDRPA
jgi:hypothetical protein